MARSLAERFIAADTAIDQTIDRLVLAFSQDVDTVTRKLRRPVTAAIEGLEVRQRPAGFLSTSARNASRAAALNGQLQRALDTAGWTKARDRAVSRLQQVGEESRRVNVELYRPPSRKEPLGTWPFVSHAQLQQAHSAYASTVADRLQAVMDGMAKDIADLARKGVVSGQERTEVIVEALEVLDSVAARLRTLYDTAAAEYAQLLTAISVQPVPKTEQRFLYSGPVDSRIRPFCLAHVGRVYTRRQIDRMDNKQLPNTFLTRGGYNCRHHWRPLPPDVLPDAGSGAVVNAPLARRVASVEKALAKTPRARRGPRT